MYKKLLLFTVACMFTATTFAQSGNCGAWGNNLTWNLNGNTLTISGTGQMAHYSWTSGGGSPWYQYSNQITRLVMAEGITVIGNYAFESCSNLTGDLTIPNSVTSIGKGAFRGCSGLTGTLTIGNSVNDIQDEAFRGCNYLTSINFGTSLTHIGEWVFAECWSLTGTLTIPNTVKTISNRAFQACSSLSTLNLGTSVTSIGEYAFWGCRGLTGTLTIPNSLNGIGYLAFGSCSGLTKLILYASMGYIADYAFAGCSGLTELTLPASIEYIGGHTFDGCSSLTSITSLATTPPSIHRDNAFQGIPTGIPISVPTCEAVASYQAAYGWNGFTNFQSITSPSGTCGTNGSNLTWNLSCNGKLTISGSGAMDNYSNNSAPWSPYRTQITSLVIGSDVTSIGNYAFFDCSNLTGALTIPNSVTSIGNYAFRDCSNLTGALTIPNSVTSIGNYAFFDCSNLTGTLTISNKLTSIGNEVFANCSNLTGTLTIPNSVTSIGEEAFFYCSGFNALTIGSGVTSIGNSAFNGCSGFTGALTIPNSVTSIGHDAFFGCSNFNGTLTISNKLTNIDYGVFFYCSGFTGTLTIPNSVTIINQQAFRYCSGFNALTIGNSVTSIGREVFSNCSGLTSITSRAVNPPTISMNNAFEGVSTEIPVSVPCGSVATYQGTAGWSAFSDYHSNPLSSGTCGSGLTWNLSCDGTLTISGSGAMDNYSNNGAPWYPYRSQITSLVIESGVTSIGNNAFNGCSALTGTLTIPSSVTSIGNYAFFDCSGLIGTLTIGNSVTSIGTSAFDSCSGLTGTLTIPNSVTSIGNTAFARCSGFNALTIGNNVITIGNTAFLYCDNFTGALTIPNSVTSIGNSAFTNCSGFNALTIGNSVTSIGYSAFAVCSGLASITSLAVNPPTISTNNAFDVVSTEIPVYVPTCEAVAKYKVKGGWDVFTDYYNMEPVAPVVINTEINYGETYSLNGFNVNTAGTYNNYANNVNGCDSTTTLNLTVLPVISTASLLDATVGAAYNQTLAIGFTTELAATWSVSADNLPAGLSLDTNTGTITGTPTTAGNVVFTVKAETNEGDITKELTITVQKGTPVITWSTLSAVTYGEAAPTLDATASGTGVTLSYSSNNAAVATVSGSTLTITGAGTATITASTAVNDNYNAATTVDKTLTVYQKDLTVINLDFGAKTYDGTGVATPSDTPALSGVVYNEDVTLNTSGVSFAFDDKNVGTTNISRNGTYTLGGEKAGNYVLTQPLEAFTGSITAKDITLTVTDQPNVVYGTAVTPAYTANFNVGSIGDSFTGALAIDGERSTSGNLKVGNHNIVQNDLAISDGNNGGNYNLLFVGDDFTVTAKPATIINLTAANKVYDGNTTAAILGTAAINGKVEGDILNVVAGEANFDTKHVANGKTVTFTGFSLSGTDVLNYTFAGQPANVTANITQATLTVTPDEGQSKIYGNIDPELTFQYSGFVAGDDATLFSGTLTREAGIIVGTYAIQQGNLSAGANYTISFTEGKTFAIDRAVQSITFDPATILQVENGRYDLVATASSGLEVQFRLRTGDDTFANLSATTLTPLQSGQIEVTAFIENDHNYLDAAESRTITIISSNAAVGSVELSNVTKKAPDFYVVDCGINEVSITIAPEEIGAKVWHNGGEGKTFRLNTSRADVYTVNYSVESSAGTTVDYRLTVEKQFTFGDIVGSKFNNVLFVNNNPATNGGYHFKAYEWFENGRSIGDGGQYYSAGNKRNDLLNESSQYSVVLTTDDGKILHTCEGAIDLRSESLRVYPNPAKQGEPITIEYTAPKEASKITGDATIQVYDAEGMLVDARQLLNGSLQHISLSTAGIYLVKVGNEIVKIIVK